MRSGSQTTLAGPVVAIVTAAAIAGCSGPPNASNGQLGPLPNPSAAAIAEFKVLREDIELHVRACQLSTTDYGPDFAQGDPTTIYAQATHFRDGCEGARMHLEEVQFGPNYDPRVAEMLEVVTRECASAVSLKREAFAEVASAADTAFRPLKVAVAQAFLKNADERITSCLSQIGSRAEQAKLTPAPAAMAAGSQLAASRKSDVAERPTSPPSLPPDASSLVTEYDRLNELCRGGVGDSAATQQSCQQRDAVEGQLKSLGWCWSERSDAPSAAEADGAWRSCS